MKGLQRKPDWNGQNAVTSKVALNRRTERKFLQPGNHGPWGCALSEAEHVSAEQRTLTKLTQSIHNAYFFLPFAVGNPSLKRVQRFVLPARREKELKDHSCCNIPSPGVSSTGLPMAIPRGRLPEGSSPSLPHLTCVTHTLEQLAPSEISQIHES